MALKSFLKRTETEAGCDEAGRGCLAGPVFAAAVILPRDFFHPLLNDSKQIVEEDRYYLREVIQEHALTWAVSFVTHEMIDRINILNASILAMHQALGELAQRPSFILVDGNRFKRYRRIPHQCIIKGDEKFASIAAASILAKTYRDDFMKQLHEQFPWYNWKQNKGYPTEEHRLSIEKYGVCSYHRLTFHMFGDDDPNQMVLFKD